MKLDRVALLTGIVAMVLAGAAPAGEAPTTCPSIEALTTPSKDLLLSYNLTGRIASVSVKEGDMVKVGQVLVQQDDKAEKTAMEKLRIAAESDVRVKAAKAKLDQSKLDLENLQYAMKQKAATQYEVDHAALDVTMAQLSLELSDVEKRQAELEYQEALCHVERMKLCSPIDGKVERIMIREGETADPQSKVIRVVKLDPLWIDVPVPLPQCRNLKVDQKAMVVFDDLSQPLEGKIAFIAAVAEPGSETLTIRVELPNPENRRAGEHVKIRFPASENAKSAEPTSRAATQESKESKKE